ncbi:MAG TPA: gliding motility-associated C-terminal domain-containing protein [Chitinophagales bacterium]|nr:gliding motility-associated C-terminal domain-containing protein [Chitinophagales bacterium]
MKFLKSCLIFSTVLFVKPALACVGTDVQLDINSVTCYDQNNGTIKVLETLISDKTPYKYSLNGAAFTANPLFTGLTPGSYSLVIKNTDNCDFTYPDAILIEQPDSINLNIISDPIVCGSDAKLYAQISGGVGPYLYEWNNDPKSNLDTLRNLSAGTYSLTITDQNNCVKIKNTEVLPGTAFSVSVMASSEQIQVGDIVELSVESLGGGSQLSYQWFPISGLDCSTCSETTAKLFYDTQITVVVNDTENGCIASDSVFIKVDGVFSLYIPNAFSPNSDNKNEKFLAYGVGIAEATANIYDKSGFLIFEGDLLNNGWDGTISGNPARDGLYFYHAKITYADDTIREQKGQITLIR